MEGRSLVVNCQLTDIKITSEGIFLFTMYDFIFLGLFFYICEINTQHYDHAFIKPPSLWIHGDYERSLAVPGPCVLFGIALLRI